jgi:hypothetical protein
LQDAGTAFEERCSGGLEADAARPASDAVSRMG